MKDDVTPIRRQYLRVKRAYPQALVLFRLGDFYETFDEDARVLARDLDIVLTSREMGKGQRVPMAGFPCRALDSHLARLVNLGHKVAICEQMTTPGATKGIVDREVTRVVTPGTVVEPALLDSRKNNYLASLILGETEAGIAYVDITTGEFATTQLPADRAQLELNRLRPSEIVCPEGMDLEGWGAAVQAGVTRFDAFAFDTETSITSLLEHFKAVSLEGYGCAALPLATRAAGAIVQYVRRTQKAALVNIATLSTYSTESFMVLDEQTMSNLEILRNGRTASPDGSLLGAIDMTGTPMGSRLLRRWLSQPLLDLDGLMIRQAAVSWFCTQTMIRAQIVSLLTRMGDLERMTNRVVGGVALPRELVALRRESGSGTAGDRYPRWRASPAVVDGGHGDATGGRGSDRARHRRGTVGPPR
jgi:DNA mismatch repair protein MutS